MPTTVENLKKEISDCYFKDLKKQLGWFKSIAVLPIEKPIKDILMGKGELPEKFDEVKEFGWRKDIINFVSPQLANEIFEYIKTKRLEIEKRKTESELTELKNQILGLTSETTPPTQSPQSSIQSGNGSSVQDGDGELNEDSAGRLNPENRNEQISGQQETQETSNHTNGAVAGIETAIVGGAGALALERIASKNVKAIEELSPEKMKATIEGVIEATKNKRNAIEHRLTKKQLKVLNNNIKKLEASIGNANSGSVDLLKERDKLGNKLKISRTLLENCGLNAKELSKISQMAGELVDKTEEEIKNLLKSKGITKIDDNIVKALSKADTADDIKAMTKILRNGSKINRMLQTLAGALWIDVAFTGLDVWMLIEQRKEAELISKINELRGKNKYSQAWTQFGIGVSSVVIEGLLIWAAGGAASGGLVGAAIGLGVGALTTTASIGADTFYFDVKDFYLQNQEDFLRQTRAKLKQAILQGVYNKKQGDGSFNEHITSFLSPSLKPGSELKEKSLNDACASMIFLEEIDEGGELAYNQLLREYVQSGKNRKDFLSNKDEKDKNEFEQVRKRMEERINVRMQYILEEFKKPNIVDSIDKGTGMKDLTDIFTNSRVFAELKELNKWNDSKSAEENLENYKYELLSNFPNEKIQKFEELRQNNPNLFMEIISTVSVDAFIYGEEDDEENQNLNYVQNVKMVVAYKKRLEFTQSVEDKRYLNIDKMANSKFIENLLISDFDLSKTKYPSMKPEKVINMVNFNCERFGLIDISDNPIQNILYRLARELYGYSGENNIQGLMGFFSESSDNNYGIYYTSKRKINKDWSIDKMLKDTMPSDFHDSDIDKIISDFISKNMIGQSSIDTPTESIDDKLNLEFKNKIQELLKEELLCRSIEHKDLIKSQILEFVKQHSKNGEYIELPYFLVLEAKKSGLGDLQRQFLKRENDKIGICYLPSEINQTCLFDDAEKLYVSPARESFTEEEQYYIDRVETARNKIEILRNVPGICITGEGKEDDLDLPIEIEHLISEKVKEREIFKKNVLMYNEDVASIADEKYKEFATYFENMYRGMLMTLTGFRLSNDIDSFSLFSQSLYYGSQKLFDESGNLLNIERDKLLNDTEFKKFYDEQIKTLKIGSKTIKELWESDNPKEKELGQQASNIIYTTVLEKCLILSDNEGNIQLIQIGSSTYNEYPSNPKLSISNGTSIPSQSGYTKNVMERRKSEKENIIENLSINFEKMKISVEINEHKIKQLLKSQEIKKLSQQQKEITEIIPKIQSQVENTMKNVDWRYKRGQISFDPEMLTLNSWNNKTKLRFPEDGNLEKIGLDKLELNLTLKESLRLANFRNFIKFTYGDKKVEFGIDLANKGLSWRKTLKINGTMLLTRGELESYCPICKSDEAIEKIVEWLNY